MSENRWVALARRGSALAVLTTGVVAVPAYSATLTEHWYNAYVEANVSQSQTLPDREDAAQQTENGLGEARSLAISVNLTTPPDNHRAVSAWTGAFIGEQGAWEDPGVGGSFDHFRFNISAESRVDFDGTQTPDTDAMSFGTTFGSIAFSVAEQTAWSWAGSYLLSADGASGDDANQLVRLLLLRDIDANTVETLYTHAISSETAGEMVGSGAGVIEPGNYRVVFNATAYTDYVTADALITSSFSGDFYLNAVPEPASATVLAPLALALLRRRGTVRAGRRAGA